MACDEQNIYNNSILYTLLSIVIAKPCSSIAHDNASKIYKAIRNAQRLYGWDCKQRVGSR